MQRRLTVRRQGLPFHEHFVEIRTLQEQGPRTTTTLSSSQNHPPRSRLSTNRNGQQTSAHSLGSRWRHEIQMSILRRRAAMTRATLPNMSSRDVWLLNGLIDREATPNWSARPLDEDGDDEGATTVVCDEDNDTQSSVSTVTEEER